MFDWFSRRPKPKNVRAEVLDVWRDDIDIPLPDSTYPREIIRHRLPVTCEGQLDLVTRMTADGWIIDLALTIAHGGPLVIVFCKEDGR